MAIALVGQAGIAGSSVASPQTITYGSTGGNTLILTGHLYDLNNNVFIAPTSVTDTAGNTWYVSINTANTALVTPSGSGSIPPTASLADPDDGATSHQSDWVAWSVGAAAVTSVTIAWAGGQTTFARIALAEYSGVVQFDNSWAGGSSTAGASGSVAASLTVHVTGELAVGAIDFGGSGTPSIPAGWTQFTSSLGQCAYLIGPAVGAFSPTWTDTVAGSYTGAAALFSPVALGGPPPPPQPGGKAWRRRFRRPQTPQWPPGTPAGVLAPFTPPGTLHGRAATAKSTLASIQVKPPATGGPAAPFFPPHILFRGAAAAVKGKLAGQRGQPGQPSPFRLPGLLKGPAAARPGKLASARGRPGIPAPFTPPRTPLKGRAAAGPGKMMHGSAPQQTGQPSVPSPFFPPHFPARGPAAARKGALTGIVAPPPVTHPNVPAPFFPPHVLLRGQAPVRARTPLTGAIAPPPAPPPAHPPHWQGSTHMPDANSSGNLILGANHTGTGGAGDLKGDYERSGD